MSENNLEKVKDFNRNLVNVLKQENGLQVDTLMTEAVVEFAENSMKWTEHKWNVDLSEDKKEVTRDGVTWDNVRFIGAEYDFKDITPRLVIESDFNDFDIKMNKDGSQLVFYKGEWIEEVQKYEINNDPENDFITRIRLTVIGDVKLNWDYGVERGERENPNISFPKINYHKDPMITANIYQQVTGESEQTVEQIEGAIDE